MIKIGKDVEDVTVLYADDSFDCRMAVTVLETTLRKAYPNKCIHVDHVKTMHIIDKFNGCQVFVIGEIDTECPDNFLVFTKGVEAEKAFSLKPNYRSAVKKFGLDYGYTHKVVDEILDKGAKDTYCNGLFGKPPVDDDWTVCSGSLSDFRASNYSIVANKQLEDWYLEKLEGIQKISASESMELLEELAEMKSLSFALDRVREALSAKDKILLDDEMIQQLKEHREVKFNLLRELIGSSFVDNTITDCESYKILCMNSSKFDKDIIKIVEQEIFAKSKEDIANFDELNPLYAVRDIDSLIIVDRANGKYNVATTHTDKVDKEFLDLYARSALASKPAMDSRPDF